MTRDVVRILQSRTGSLGAAGSAHALPTPFSQREASPIVFFLLFEIIAGCEEKIAFVACEAKRRRKL